MGSRRRRALSLRPERPRAIADTAEVEAGPMSATLWPKPAAPTPVVRAQIAQILNDVPVRISAALRDPGGVSREEISVWREASSAGSGEGRLSGQKTRPFLSSRSNIRGKELAAWRGLGRQARAIDNPICRACAYHEERKNAYQNQPPPFGRKQLYPPASSHSQPSSLASLVGPSPGD